MRGWLYLQRRARQSPLVPGRERKDCARSRAAPVLDAVRLIQHHSPPPHLQEYRDIKCYIWPYGQALQWVQCTQSWLQACSKAH